MSAELPEDAVRIRNLYPVMKCDRAVWKRIIALCRTGKASDITAAEDLARACTNKTPRTRAMHVGALRKRIMRRAFLVQQKKDEAPILDVLKTLADRIDTILNRESRDGVIPQARYRAAVEAIADRNKEAYTAIASSFQAALRSAVKTGLLHSMRNAEAVVANANGRKAAEADYRSGDSGVVVPLDEADPLKQQLTYSPSSSVFKKLFKGALKDTMTAGLFGGKRVSTRVWDLRDGNMAQIKRQLAAGIARGDDPATISRAIRGILVQPKTLRGAARADATPGAGVYRSAYANAMRLTRTETNRAYILSDTLFAEDKGWNLIWTVSTGAREEDECLRKGTIILTRHRNVAIEDVKEGDLVLTHQKRWRRVIKTFKNKIQGGSLVRLLFQEGKNRTREIFCTPNHPFLIDGKWIQACDLKMGCLGTAAPLSRFGQVAHTSSDDSYTTPPDSERSSTSRHQEIIGAVLHDASLFRSQDTPDNDRDTFSPKAGSPAGGDSGTESYRPYSSDFLFRAAQEKVSFATRLISLACWDAFSRSSRCAVLFLEHMRWRNILHYRPFAEDGTSSCKSSMPAVLSDAVRDSNHSSNISDSDHAGDAHKTFHMNRIELAGESCGINRNTGGYKIFGAASLFFFLLGLPMGAAGFFSRTFHKVCSLFYYTLLCVHIPHAILIKKEIVMTGDEFVYNLAVEEDNSYFANGIAVHNCDDLGGREMTPEEFADNYPVHPQCLCYSVLAPKTEFNSTLSDTPAETD
jgi:hypothetical protein